MFYLINDRYKYILCCFPKSGCSTIRSAHLELLGLSPPELKEHCIRNWITNMRKECCQTCNYSCEQCSRVREWVENEIDNKHKGKAYHFAQISDISEQELNDKYADYFIAVVFRDTFKRACSLFFDKLLLLRADREDNYKEKYYKDCKCFVDFLNLLKKGYFENPYLLMHYNPQIIPSHVLKRNPKVCELSNLGHLFDDHPNEELIHQFKATLAKNGVSNCLQKRPALDPPNLDLTRYDFVRDDLKLDIEKNGVPPYCHFDTDEVQSLLNDVYKGEIEIFSSFQK